MSNIDEQQLRVNVSSPASMGPVRLVLTLLIVVHPDAQSGDSRAQL